MARGRIVWYSINLSLHLLKCAVPDTLYTSYGGDLVMSKNIVICSDGTGNAAIKGRGTNVFKIYEAVDVHGHKHDDKADPQIAFYDDGVGTVSWVEMSV